MKKAPKKAAAKAAPVMIELDFKLRATLFNYIDLLANEIRTDVNGHASEFILDSATKIIGVARLLGAKFPALICESCGHMETVK